MSRFFSIYLAKFCVYKEDKKMYFSVPDLTLLIYHIYIYLFCCNVRRRDLYIYT